MQVIPVKEGEIVPGRPLPWSVYDGKGRLILREGEVVEQAKTLDRLLRRELYRADAEGEPVKPKKVVAAEMEPEISDSFASLYHQLQTCVLSLRERRAEAVKQLEGFAEQVQAYYQSKPLAAMFMLHRPLDWHYGALQTLRIALLCEGIGQRLAWPLQQHQQLICAALTCQVSFLLEQDVLSRQSVPLGRQQNEFVLNHPASSAYLLEQNGVNDHDWLDAVRQHHEHLDGSGYPRALRERAISPLARVIGLAEYYVARVTPCAFRRPVSPRTVQQSLYRERGHAFDSEASECLIKEVGFYPPASGVVLATGETAIVAEVRPSAMHSPRVVSVIDASGNIRESMCWRDTSQPEYHIEHPIEDTHILPLDWDRLWSYCTQGITQV